MVVGGHSIGGVAGMLFAATPGTGALAVVQLVLAAFTLVALTDLRRRRLA
jgi:hypothetical protein